MLKRFIAICLMTVLLAGLLVFPAEAATSGKVGNLRWSYNQSTHTLTITGTGPMPSVYNENEFNSPPWKYYGTDCYPIERVVVGEGVTSTGPEAFSNYSLLSVKLPSTLKTIGASTFEHTEFVSGQLEIPAGVKTIEPCAFRFCDGLKTLTLPSSVKELGNRAFEYSSIESINLEHVEVIGEQAFENAQYLKGSVDLTALRTMGKYAFSRCQYLTGVRFGNQLREIPMNAFSDANICALDLPGNITTVGIEAFQGCPINRLTLHEGLVNVCEGAFTLFLVHELELPSTLRTLGQGALQDHNRMPIYLNQGVKEIGPGGISEQKVLAVPASVKYLGVRMEPVIALGKPFQSMSSNTGYSNWYEGSVIYSFYPKEKWNQRNFEKTEFRMLEPEPMTLYVGQVLPFAGDTAAYSLLDGRRVSLENGLLKGIKPCADVLIHTEEDQVQNVLVQVLPLPQSCDGNHIWTLTKTEPGDCVTPGLRHYACMVCGAEKTEDSVTDPSRHAWSFTELLTEGESLHASTGLYTCTRCGETKEAPICAREVFTDVPKSGSWAHDPIDWAYFRGITGGTTATTFTPNGIVTRAEAMTFLWAALDRPEATLTESPFRDVKAKHWFYDSVLWAVEHQITGGVKPDKFAPDLVCSRAQIVTFLWAAAGRPEPEHPDNPFADVKEKDWFYQAVLWAAENGVTGGVDASHFCPDRTCTRAQAVTFLRSAYPILTAEETPEQPEDPIPDPDPDPDPDPEPTPPTASQGF